MGDCCRSNGDRNDPVVAGRSRAHRFATAKTAFLRLVLVLVVIGLYLSEEWRKELQRQCLCIHYSGFQEDSNEDEWIAG